MIICKDDLFAQDIYHVGLPVSEKCMSLMSSLLKLFIDFSRNSSLFRFNLRRVGYTSSLSLLLRRVSRIAEKKVLT